MKIVIELLSILSIATKEVEQRRASELPERVLSQFALHDSCYCRVICQETTWEDKTNTAVQKVSKNTEEVKRDVDEVKLDVEEVKCL